MNRRGGRVLLLLENPWRLEGVLYVIGGITCRALGIAQDERKRISPASCRYIYRDTTELELERSWILADVARRSASLVSTTSHGTSRVSYYPAHVIGIVNHW